ncbi:MAG: tRNA (guanosine(37)-N1)-methyltransferase TrmD [Lachnospiraceae bacterium]|nr:tRNA (guanosine(37)-N1)-methyltransferase TrmD [Lachnospiraceae bacterium]
MNFYCMTLFPEMIDNAFSTSITGRAMNNGYLNLHTVNIRDFANNTHNSVDDYPFGGGAGMLMQAEPIYRCYEHIIEEIGKETRVILTTPVGKVFNQAMAAEFAQEENLIFLCGHYEGIDERVIEKIVTDRVSIGDYVLTGGELPALVMMDSISRLVPCVLSNSVSSTYESHSNGLLEYPQYTRPREWNGMEVPEVLLSGHHKNIAAWQKEESLKRTKKYRPDLYKKWEEEQNKED